MEQVKQIYQNIGENNQLIIATHSPYVIGDIKSEQLRIIKRDENRVIIVSNDQIDETYGHIVESILMCNMGVKSMRNNDVQFKLDELRRLLGSNLYNEERFKMIYEELINDLGTLDVDLNLIDLEIRRRERKKGR